MPRHAFDRWTPGTDASKEPKSAEQKKADLEIKIEQKAQGLSNHEGILDTEVDPNYEASGFVVFNEQRISQVQESVQQIEAKLEEWSDLLKGQSIKNTAQRFVDNIKGLAGEIARNHGISKGAEMAIGEAEMSKQVEGLRKELSALYTQLDRVTGEADNAISGANVAKMELKQLLDTYSKFYGDGEVN